MNNMDLSKPTRQSIKGLAFIFLQSIRQAVRMFWALIAVVVLQKNLLENKSLIGISLIVILILLVVHSIMYYLNFYFYVKDGEFILKKGYLRKKILTIPLERIQSVNTKQNLFQQLLDVVALEIDTAGAASKELKIHALEKSFASELHILLSKTKTEIKVEKDREQINTRNEKLILQLAPVDLLKIGISQNHLRAGLIILAFGMQIFNQIQDLFKEKAEQYSSEVINYISDSSWALITFMLIFFLFVSILFSLFRTLLKYFDFKLLKKQDTYRIESGLINKRNVIVPHNKVQELNWETGPLKQIFGIFHLTFKQAVSGQQNRKNQQLVDAPGCLTAHLDLLKNDLFGLERLSDAPVVHTNSYYFRRLWIISGWIPVMVVSPFMYSEWLFWLGAVFWLLAAAGYSYLMLRKRYFRMNEEQIRISKGAISHQWKQMELFKIQAVEFRQTIFQKRRKLASLQLMNASGSMTIPFIDELLAKQIYDYLLYHTEISERKWM